MTVKNLAETKYSNAVQAGANIEKVVLYTVPGGKSAIIKEILVSLTKSGAVGIHIYILKSGGVDLSGAPAVLTFGANEALVAAPGADVLNETVDGGLQGAVALTVLARNTILAAGDAVKLAGIVTGAIAVDNTRAKIIVSGDEF